jgi:predicted DNA-binding protein (MmcQ/YjbR family)
MNVEKIRKMCLALPHVTEDVKWGHDLCFCIAEKMPRGKLAVAGRAPIFVVLGVDNVPVSASFKVKDEEFEEMSNRKGFKPAPYVARYKWVYTDDIKNLSEKEWKQRVQTAYELVKGKLPKSIQKTLK